ncbi:MAG: polysaccharide deacetylase family protein [Acidobacteriota bacterium]
MRLASLSLDLDNEWTYLRTHGDAGWESYPSYLDVVVPHVLRLLDERDLKITFFIVGQDATRPENRDALAAIPAAGHEIANHSFQHEQWLHLYEAPQLDRELAQAEEAIEGVTGVRTEGFRGPGYSLSTSTLRVLVRRGYRYDASTFPTYLGPLARAYYFRTAKLSPEEREQRRKLFGTLRDGTRPVSPYRWQLDEGSILELPVTTLPLFKIPFHLSYLLYLGAYSHLLAKLYFHKALWLCRLAGVQPSLLLHPLDFLGGDDCGSLSFFPAMRLGGELKRRRAGEFLDIYRRHFTVVPMGQHVDAIERGSLPLRAPDFRDLSP